MSIVLPDPKSESNNEEVNDKNVIYSVSLIKETAH